MAKLYTDEINKIIEAARDEALLHYKSDNSFEDSMTMAFNHGVRVAVSTIQYKLAHHDYEELVKHDE